MITFPNSQLVHIPRGELLCLTEAPRSHLRKQTVMSNRGNPSTSTEASCYVQQDVNSMEDNLTCRTKCVPFCGEICVPIQPADPLKSTASAALQNGLMFQPHSESTSFTSWGAEPKRRQWRMKRGGSVVSKRVLQAVAKQDEYYEPDRTSEAQ